MEHFILKRTGPNLTIHPMVVRSFEFLGYCSSDRLLGGCIAWNSSVHCEAVWMSAVKKCTNLDLGEGDLKAKALIEVRIQSVLFDCCLLLLQSLPVVLQHHLNKGI